MKSDDLTKVPPGDTESPEARYRAAALNVAMKRRSQEKAAAHLAMPSRALLPRNSGEAIGSCLQQPVGHTVMMRDVELFFKNEERYLFGLVEVICGESVHTLRGTSAKTGVGVTIHLERKGEWLVLRRPAGVATRHRPTMKGLRLA